MKSKTPLEYSNRRRVRNKNKSWSRETYTIGCKARIRREYYRRASTGLDVNSVNAAQTFSFSHPQNNIKPVENIRHQNRFVVVCRRVKIKRRHRPPFEILYIKGSQICFVCDKHVVHLHVWFILRVYSREEFFFFFPFRFRNRFLCLYKFH